MYVGTSVTSINSAIEVAVVQAGMQQSLYRRPYDSKVFVVGVPDRSFVLHVKNLTGGRLEVLTSVDGCNALKDEPADSHRNTGLVIGAYQDALIGGWRTSDQETRKFIFGAPERSIAAQTTGTTGNVGVFGFAVYREKLNHSNWKAATFEVTRGGPAVFGGHNEVTRGGSLGTGIGERQHDVVGRTSFNRASDSPEVLVIGYDIEHVLREQGILTPAEANPFPGIPTGYAVYPQQH